MRKIHKFYRYDPFFRNSFCDTSGQLVFTELLGQHYYNKFGKIFDSSYIQNKYDKFENCPIFGSFISANNRTYYFKAFEQVSYNQGSKPFGVNWIKSDSLIICLTEFDNAGNLIKKNIPIYKLFLGSNSYRNIHFFKVIKLTEETAELFLGSYSDGRKNNSLIYNFNNGIISPKKSIELDSVYLLRNNTNSGKMVIAQYNKSILTFFEYNDLLDYKQIGLIDLSKYTQTNGKHKYKIVTDCCFAPNDSVIYITVHYEEDTASIYKPIFSYIIAINCIQPYLVYKFIPLPSTNGNNVISYYLKLGPDGNIYINGGGKTEGNFRITHPNSVVGFKFERMPDVTDGALFRNNYSLFISTLEDYKRVEFSAYPTCKGLGINFYNLSDTQFFKRYRLFFTDTDSMELSKTWQTQTYNYKTPGKYFVRLKAFSKIGGFIWYSDSIEVFAPPIAAFGIQKTKGCQWINYGFTDSSKLYAIKPGFKPYKRWFFGDGRDSLDAGTNPKLNYAYTQSNTFTVKLVVNNGYCSDTATKLNEVLILPAPRPGIVAAPLYGCTPLKVNFSRLYSDAIDSAVWHNGMAIPSKWNGPSGGFEYTTQGKYLLTQMLYGASGCITRDSVLVDVAPGISGMPDILTATVSDANAITLSWKPHPNAVKYSIIKNKAFMGSTLQTYYTDSKANTSVVNSYSVKAISICNDSTSEMDEATTILLKAEHNERNEAQLNWTPYQKWELGVNNYKIFSANTNGGFDLLGTAGGTDLQYLDRDFAKVLETQRCYKVMSVEQEGNFQESQSNIVCVPLRPTLLIPNAFSPNGDGTNEQWIIAYKGIVKTHLKIFNTWGEIVFDENADKPIWDGKYKGVTVPDGAYFYHLKAIGVKGETVYKHGVVEVLR